MSEKCICGKPRRIGAQNKLNRTCGDIVCKYASRKGAIRKERTEFKCECCDTLIRVTTRRIGQRFCSIDCHNLYQKRFQREKQCLHCMTSFVVGKNQEKLFCSYKCAVDSGRVRENAMKANIAQLNMTGPTRPERFLYEWLESNNIEYHPQYTIHHWVVDAFVPCTNTIIQVDGDYWHGNIEHFPNLSSKQRQRIGIDKSQNIWFEKSGYNIIRIWESDIYDNIEERLRKVTTTFTE